MTFSEDYKRVRRRAWAKGFTFERANVLWARYWRFCRNMEWLARWREWDATMRPVVAAGLREREEWRNSYGSVMSHSYEVTPW